MEALGRPHVAERSRRLFGQTLVGV